MGTSSTSASRIAGSEDYPLEDECRDEAFAPDGTVRPAYAALLGALAEQDLDGLSEEVRNRVEELGLAFGPGRPLPVAVSSSLAI